MIPIEHLRNANITDNQVGDRFLSEDGEKFIVGTARDGKPVAVMLQGERLFDLAYLDEWSRRGLGLR